MKEEPSESQDESFASESPVPVPVAVEDANWTDLSTSEKCSLLFHIFTFSYLILADVLVMSFIADAVVDFHVVQDKADAGYVTGIANLCYMIALAISSPLWCALSDRIGRRPCLIVGQVINMAAAIALSFSHNYWYFIVIRTINGFLSGNLSVAKIAMGEVSKNERVLVFAWSLLNTLGCLATVLGGVTGGFFARPVNQYPNWGVWDVGVFRTVFETFPLLLTFLACGGLELVGLILTLCIRETNVTVLNILDDDLPEEIEEEVVEMILEEQKQAKVTCKSCCEKVKAFFRTEVFRKDPILTIVTFFLVVLSGALFAQTLPVLFSLSKEDGGFGMSNYEISIVNSWVMGLSSIVVCLTICPLILNLLHPVWVLRFAPIILVVPLVFYPEVNYVLDVAGGEYIMWGLLILLTIWRSTAELTFTNVLMLSNNSVTDAGRGQFQALLNFFGFVGKGIGPFVGNSLLAVGVDVDTFPVDIHLCLLLGALAYVAIAIIAFCLPLSLRFAKKVEGKGAADAELTGEDQELESIGESSQDDGGKKDFEGIDGEEDGSMEVRQSEI